jgi:hypothetical protein
MFESNMSGILQATKKKHAGSKRRNAGRCPPLIHEIFSVFSSDVTDAW